MIPDQKSGKVQHFTRRGTIAYQIHNPEFPDGNWGFEHFILTRHANGERVFRSHCQLHDEPVLLRDVMYRVDAEFHPLDASVRLTEDDSFKGSTWYHFTDDLIEAQGFTASNGRFSDTTDIDRSIRGFGNHALVGDAWLVARFDRSQGPRQHTFYNNPLTSMDHRGATGPELVRSESTTIEYLGEEAVSVPAGEFACYHFAFVVVSNNHPLYHLWVTADGDFMFVKGTVDAPYNWSFELTELHES